MLMRYPPCSPNQVQIVTQESNRPCPIELEAWESNQLKPGLGLAPGPVTQFSPQSAYMSAGGRGLGASWVLSKRNQLWICVRIRIRPSPQGGLITDSTLSNVTCETALGHCVLFAIIAMIIGAVPEIALPPFLLLIAWLGAHWGIRKFCDVTTGTWMCVLCVSPSWQ